MMSNNLTFKNQLVQLDEKYVAMATQFSNSATTLYQFLGDCHQLVLDIGSDGDNVQSLNEALKSAEGVTDRERKLAKSVPAKVVLYVFRKSDGDLSNRSTRSNYKRAIEKAIDRNLSPSEFVQSLKDVGIVAFLSDGKNKTTSDKAGLVDKKRAALIANTVSDVAPLDLIENRNPVDTFVVIIYRADGGRLVPCYVTEESKAVNGVISAVSLVDIKREESVSNVADGSVSYISSKRAA